MRLPRLYAIIDRATLDARGVRVAEFARELRAAGVRLVQYRDKNGGPQEVLRAAVEIAAAFAGVEATLILNDRADLAVLAGWDGVHVGQGDLAVADARAILPVRGRALTQRSQSFTQSFAKGLVGVSTHTEQQVRAASAPGSENPDPGHPQVGAAGASEADYIAVGPVFRTSSKRDAEPVVGLEGVRRARELTAKPLVAIGGITRENARSVVEAGADSVAVIGGLLVEGEPVGEVARDFLEILG